MSEREAPPKKSSTKRYLILSALVVLLLAVMVTWHFWHRPPVQPDVYDFDRYQQDLADRIIKRFGTGPSSNFSIAIPIGTYPVGTLYRATDWVPADFVDCTPPVAPTGYPAGHLFPSYTLSSNTVLTANIGEHTIQGLQNAGANLQQMSTVEYGVSDAQLQIMDDKSVDEVTSRTNCKTYIAAHPGVRLIRGSITGKITFTVKVDNPASVKAQLLKIGGFSITDDPQSSKLSVSDEQTQQIVQLLSELRPVANVAATQATPVNPAQTGRTAQLVGAQRPSPSEQAPAHVTAHIFVQQDASADPQAGANVVQLLRSSWPTANVESKVELIPTEKMPDQAQVRFFNSADAAFADKCVQSLRQTYPNARVVRVGLPSPNGQLEVWLPKSHPPPQPPPVQTAPSPDVKCRVHMWINAQPSGAFGQVAVGGTGKMPFGYQCESGHLPSSLEVVVDGDGFFTDFGNPSQVEGGIVGGQVRRFSVSFKPSHAGSFTGKLTVTSPDSDPPRTDFQNPLILTGTGTQH